MFWRKKRPLNDFTEEIQSHLALEAEHLGETGRAQHDPTAAAHRAFGNIAAFQEAYYEHGRWLFFDHLLQDIRHALRLMRQRPGFTAVVVLTLALGIGANTAIFSLIDAVLLRPLPFAHPERLAMLWTDDSAHNDPEGRVSLPDFRDLRKQSQAFQDMTIFGAQTFLLGSDGSPERMREARVPANFFPLVGVEPVLGRVFSSDEETHGERVVVVSHRLWMQRFGGSRQAIGSDLIMDGRKSRIIGVMPPQFRFPFADTQVWEPITTHPYWAFRNKSSPRSSGDWYVLGRIKPGVRWTQARAEMNTITHRLQMQYPGIENPGGIRIVPLHLQTTGGVQRPLAVLFGSVFLMLLIACINVANLLLARGSSREREFALRRALGAGRLRLAAQLITESLILAITGGALGIILASFAMRAIVAFGPQDIPRLAETRLDPQVLLFTFALSLLAAVLSGLWPALQSGAPPASARQWVTIANRGVRNVLIVGEFSLALILLTGAGLLIHSFLLLRSVDPGFRPDNLLSMRIDLHVGKTKAQQLTYFQQAIDRVRTLPGVQSPAGIGRFLRSYNDEPIAIEGRPSNPSLNAADDVIIGPYFQTAGIPLRRGRFFSDSDRDDSTQVAIINDRMARACFPGVDPIGRRFRFAGRGAGPWYTIVGISADMRRQGLDKPVAPQIFRPLAQSPDNELDLLVRTSADPLTLAAAVRSQIQSIDKTVAKFGVTTVQTQLSQETSERRFHTSLIGLFSLVALFLSAIGIYGLVHHFVVQRTNEIGVRMALGARYLDVVTMVLSQGLTLACIGITAGIFGALLLVRFLTALLYEVTPTDPLTFITAPAILLFVAALACWLPARRAARVDPMRALRHD